MYSVTITDTKGVITCGRVKSFHFNGFTATLEFVNGTRQAFLVRDIVDIQITKEGITVSTNGQKEN